MCPPLAGVPAAPARHAAPSRPQWPAAPRPACCTQLPAVVRRARPAGDRPLRPAGGVLPAGCSAHGGRASPAARTAPRWSAAARVASSHPPAATSASIGHSIATPLPTAPPSSRVVYGATPAAGHPPRATSRIDRPSHPFPRRRTPSGAGAPAVRGAPAPSRVRQPDGRASPRPNGDRQDRTRRLELTGRPWARNRPAERPGTGDHRSRIHSDPRPGGPLLMIPIRVCALVDQQQTPARCDHPTRRGVPAPESGGALGLLAYGPRSSGDRAPPSGGGSAGSNPAGGTTCDLRLLLSAPALLVRFAGPWTQMWHELNPRSGPRRSSAAHCGVSDPVSWAHLCS